MSGRMAGPNSAENMFVLKSGIIAIKGLRTFGWRQDLIEEFWTNITVHYIIESTMMYDIKTNASRQSTRDET